jgi:hypothetical protein
VQFGLHDFILVKGCVRIIQARLHNAQSHSCWCSNNLAAAAAADAGADFASFRQPGTGYSLVQAAADKGQFEAVVKLVEAGASWRLPKRGQEFAGCATFDLIATLVKPGLKVGTRTTHVAHHLPVLTH